MWEVSKPGLSLNFGVSHNELYFPLSHSDLSLICRWHSKGLESALDTRIYLCSSGVLPVCLTDFCVPLPLAAGRGNRGNSTCE